MPHPVRNLFGSLLVCLLLVSSTVGNAREPVQSSDSGPNQMDLYYSGRPAAAISAWMHLLNSPSKEASQSQLIYSATELAGFCALANDDQCVFDAATLVANLGALEGIAEPEMEAVRLNLGLLYGLAAQSSRDSSWITRIFEHGLLGQNENPYFSPILYVKRQFLAAALFLQLEQHRKAGDALDKGFIALASIETARPLTLEYGQALSQAVALFTQVGRTADAVGLASAARGFILAALPENGVEHARFLAIDSVLLFQSQYLEESRIRAELALAKFAALDLPAYNFAGERLELSVIRAAACAIIGPDLPCIDDALNSIRQEMVFFDRSDNAAGPTYIEAYVTVIEILIRTLSGTQHQQEDTWKNNALKILSGTWEFEAEDELEAGRSLGIALLRLWAGDVDSVLYATQALERLLKADRWAQPERVGSLLFPEFSGRLIASTATALLTHERLPNSYESSLILQAVELYSRTGQFKDSDSLAEIASAVSSDDKSVSHALLRIRSREANHRNRLIGERVAEVMSDGPTEPELARINFSSHKGLVDLATRRLRLEGYLKPGGRLTPIPNFPTAAEVQSHLTDGEVLLYIAASMGSNIISVCVTPDSVSAISLEIDKVATRLDFRVLKLALTAVHAASDELDSQYPVDAARRIYETFVGHRMSGPHQCIEPGDTVFFAPAHTLNGVPLETTLMRVPDRDEIGWKLGTARWAFQANKFVYLQSSRAFIAQRILHNQSRVSGFEVLTVGDPILDGKTREGISGLTAVTRGAGLANNDTLGALAALPNTAEESKRVFETLGGIGRILTGNQATERELRTDFLGRYRFLHLATHGLVREELTGLREAALVLTPGSVMDPFDDGLLTASEIADLSLNADIAVLSACNTGIFDGEFFTSETQGLTTAFAIAGVPATIVTLWPVETFSSETLVTSFFEQFAPGGVRASEALVKARQAIVGAEQRAYHHPRFWGAFVLFGETESRLDTSSDGFVRIKLFDETGGVRGIAAHSTTPDTFISWGTYNQDKLTFSISRITESLDVLWQYDRPDMARSAIAHFDDERLFAWGYEFKDNLPSPIVVAVSQKDGRELGVRRTINESQPGYIRDVVPMAEGRLAVLSTHAENPYAGTRDESKVIYAFDVLDFDLNPLASLRLPFELSGGMPMNIGLAVSGQNILAFAGEHISFSDDMRLGRFDMYETCAKSRSTHLVWLSADGSKVDAAVVAEDILIRDVLVSSSGEFYFLGAEQSPCSSDLRMVVGKLSPGSGTWSPLYTDKNPFSSLPVGIRQSPQGDFVIASSISRDLDANFDPPDLTSSGVESFFHSSLFMRARQTSDGRITWLSPKGDLLYERMISGGSDVLIDDIAISGHAVVVGGEIGSRPFFLTVNTPLAISTPH